MLCPCVKHVPRVSGIYCVTVEKLKQQEKQNDHHDTNLVASRKKQLSKTTLIANATLFFIGMVLIRLTTSILHIFKLIFNVFLLLQVVALDHYSLTAYSYSINLWNW